MKFKVIKESKDTKIEVENPGLLEVPKGKKVYDLPVSHFKKLIDKKGRAAIMRGINNLAVWSKNDDPKMKKWAEDMKKSLEGYGEKKEESLKEYVEPSVNLGGKSVYCIVNEDTLEIVGVYKNKADAVEFFSQTPDEFRFIKAPFFE